MSLDLEASRERLLVEIKERMVKNGIFLQDVWERLLQTCTEVLVEIAASDFDQEVLRRMKKENTKP